MIRHIHRAPAALLLAAMALASCAPATAPSDAGATPAPSASAAPVPSEPAAAGSSPSASTSTAAPAVRASCRRVERPALQQGSHLLGDQQPPVPYSSRPPTSGWHSSGHFEVGISDVDDPLSEPEQVSVLEAEGVVVAYHGLARDDVARLTRLVHRRYRHRVAVTPYDRLGDGTVAFTAWGVLQRCDGLDVAALRRFVRRFGTDQPITPGH